MKTDTRFHYTFEHTIGGLSPLKVEGKRFLYVDKCQDGTWIAFSLRSKEDVEEAKKKLKKGHGYIRPDNAVISQECREGEKVVMQRPQPITIDGVRYKSFGEATRLLGYSRGFLFKKTRLKIIQENAYDVSSKEIARNDSRCPRKIYVDGVEYPSMASCARHFGLSEIWFKNFVAKVKTNKISTEMLEGDLKKETKTVIFDNKTYKNCMELATALGVQYKSLRKSIFLEGVTSSKELRMSGKTLFYNGKLFYVRRKISVSYADALKAAKNLNDKDWISLSEIEGSFAGERSIWIQRSEYLRHYAGHDVFSNFLSREKVEKYTFRIDWDAVQDGYCSLSAAVSFRISEFQGFFCKVEDLRRKELRDKFLVAKLAGIIRREFGGELLPYEKEVPYFSSRKKKIKVYPLEKIDEYIDILKRRGVYCLERKKLSVDTVSMSGSWKVQNVFYGNSSTNY